MDQHIQQEKGMGKIVTKLSYVSKMRKRWTRYQHEK